MTTATDQREIDRLREENARLRSQVGDFVVTEIVCLVDESEYQGHPHFMKERAKATLIRDVVKRMEADRAVEMVVAPRPINGKREMKMRFAYLRTAQHQERAGLTDGRDVNIPSIDAPDWHFEQYALDVVQRTPHLMGRVARGEGVNVVIMAHDLSWFRDSAPVTGDVVNITSPRVDCCVMRDRNDGKVVAYVVSR